MALIPLLHAFPPLRDRERCRNLSAIGQCMPARFSPLKLVRPCQVEYLWHQSVIHIANAGAYHRGSFSRLPRNSIRCWAEPLKRKRRRSRLFKSIFHASQTRLCEQHDDIYFKRPSGGIILARTQTLLAGQSLL